MTKSLLLLLLSSSSSSSSPSFHTILPWRASREKSSWRRPRNRLNKATLFRPLWTVRYCECQAQRLNCQVLWMSSTASEMSGIVNVKHSVWTVRYCECQAQRLNCSGIVNVKHSVGPPMKTSRYVCMYVCMYVCTYVCMYVCMYVSLAQNVDLHFGRSEVVLLHHQSVFGIRFWLFLFF
jgi:hypothetical protein